MSIFTEEFINQFLFEPIEKLQEQLTIDYPGFTATMDDKGNTHIFDPNGKVVTKIYSGSEFDFKYEE